ncbi:hypothetical protein BCR39DRAFT_551588 [Naematelia encephala]|uniref:Uncharacterized protein n=1 Tax=Naematelia encephala TaxID=71784 RepID=A0A1Y2AJP4_9TREE|nr:hypothetical protein BCR39DRAFT_551588 [Naematelia encephala]
MTLLTTLAAYQTPLSLILALAGPTIVPRLLSLRASTRSGIQKPPRQALTSLTKAILALHTVYLISQLVFPPYDLFTSNRLPILTPNDILRQYVSRNHLSSPIARQDELDFQVLLLQRLQSLDYRLLYARLGHESLSSCVWCTSPTDFLITALPGLGKVYVLELILLGVLSTTLVGGVEQASRRSNRWRSSFAWVLLGMILGEVGVRWFWDVRVVDGDCLHLSTTLHTLRSLILLFLPLFFLLLPIPSAKPDPSALFSSLNNTTSTLRLTSLTRTAALRSSALRSVLLRKGEMDARDDKSRRDDPAVQMRIKNLGLHVVEEIRQRGARWIREAWSGMIRIERGVADQSDIPGFS